MKIRIGIILSLIMALLTSNVLANQVELIGDELPKVKKVIMEGPSTWMITDNGEVYVCGKNTLGELGTGEEKDVLIPIQILKGIKIKEIVAELDENTPGWINAYYLTENGEVYVSGVNHEGQLGCSGGSKNTPVKIISLDKVKIKKIVKDNNSTYFLSEVGDVYACGNNTYGQLGLGETENFFVDTVTKVKGLDGITIKEIIAQDYITVFLTETGEVYVCGANKQGELGLGHTSDMNIPTKIKALEGIKIKSIKMNDKNEELGTIYYIAENGSVYTSGAGNSSVTKVESINRKKIKNIFQDEASIYFLTEESILLRNSTQDLLKSIKVKKVVTCNNGTSVYYLTEDGKVYVSGYNNYGQLGLGNTNDYVIGVDCKLITALDEVKVKDIITQQRGVYFLTEDGEVYVCGDNKCGQLGAIYMYNAAPIIMVETPRKVIFSSGETLRNVKEIVTNGQNGTAFLTENGKVYVCGNNEFGQLGIEYITSEVAGPHKIKKVANEIIKELEEENKKTTGFSDVEKEHWAASAIKYVSDKGIMGGVGNNEFNPTGPVTRDMFATVISRLPAQNGLKVKEKKHGYKDADAFQDWAKDAIYKYGSHIYAGSNNQYYNYFTPKANVKRKEVVLALVRALELDKKVNVTSETKKKVKDIEKKEGFDFDDEDEDLENALGVIIQTGIMNGDNNGKFNINDNVTREQLANIIYLLYNGEAEVNGLCRECGEKIGDKWIIDDTEHWKECEKKHRNNDAEHTLDKNNKCSVCQNIIEECTKSSCKGYLLEGYKADKSNHWRVCSKDHGKINSKNHEWDGDICKVCYYNKNTGKIDEDYKGNQNVEFNDISGHWAEEEIKFVVEKGIMSGMSVGTFNPEGLVPRAQVAAIISKMAAEDSLGIKRGDNRKYTDVSSDHWAKDAITKYGSHITKETYFNPDNTYILRYEIPLIILRASDIESKVILRDDTLSKVEKAKDEISVIKEAEELEKALAIAIQTGIMNGNENGEYNLYDNVTRAQLAKVIYNIYNIKEDSLKEKCTIKSGCTGYMLSGYKSDESKHWKECSKGHQETKVAHDGDICSVCGYEKQKNEETKKPNIREESGCLVIDIVNANFKPGVVNRVVVDIDSTNIMKIQGIAAKATPGEVQILHNEGNELEVFDGQVSIIIKPGTKAAEIIGKDDHKIIVDIDDYHIGDNIVGIFEKEEQKEREKCSKGNCDAYIVGFEANTQYHQKVCEKGHTSGGKVNHYFNGDPVCDFCQYNKNTGRIGDPADDKSICPICKVGVKYRTTDTMHVIVCSKNSKHILSVDDHVLDSNKKCTVCGKTVNVEYNMDYFTDYPSPDNSNLWAWNSIGHMNKLDILRGSNNGDGTFTLLPTSNIKSEALVALVARALGYKKGDIINKEVYMPIDKDVIWTEQEWKYLMLQLGDNAKEEMQMLFAEEEKSATDDYIRKYYSGQELTREKVAYLIGAFIDENPLVDKFENNFKDWGDVTSIYKERLKKLVALNILRGVSNPDGSVTINPDARITRQEVAVLVDRLYALKYAK